MSWALQASQDLGRIHAQACQPTRHVDMGCAIETYQGAKALGTGGGIPELLKRGITEFFKLINDYEQVLERRALCDRMKQNGLEKGL